MEGSSLEDRFKDLTSDWFANMLYICKLNLLSSFFKASHFIITLNDKKPTPMEFIHFFHGLHVIESMGRAYIEAFLFRYNFTV